VLLVCAVIVATIAEGCVMLTVCVCVQEFASLIVQVYVPAVNPEAVAAVPPVGAHAYVNTPVPPEAATVADPLFPPLHETLVDAEIVEVIAEGCVMLTVCVWVQEFASVIVHV
jgi:hypothetical protein